MPKVKNNKIYTTEMISKYNYQETKVRVLQYFSTYRLYMAKIDTIMGSYNDSLANDNLGIFSNQRSDHTSSKALRIVEYKEYIDDMNKKLRKLRLKLTDDEKIIFNCSILSNHTDEELAEELSLDKTNIYKRKKSCFIKVAQYFNIEVLNND